MLENNIDRFESNRLNRKNGSHGFRSLALGILKEKLNNSHEVADRLLAHVPKSGNDCAYVRAKFLPQCTEMMQRYADYIDEVMSRDFKLRFDEMRDNNPSKKDVEQSHSFSSPGHVRNICFVCGIQDGFTSKHTR
jgi:hypothetical protein